MHSLTHSLTHSPTHCLDDKLIHTLNHSANPPINHQTACIAQQLTHLLNPSNTNMMMNGVVRMLLCIVISQKTFCSARVQVVANTVSSTKYLGVLLDEHLTFDDHINYIHKKASNKLGILYRAKDYLDRQTKILLYKSLILPHLDFCDIVYMSTTEYNLNKLQLIQNTACRTILGADKDTSIKDMHKQLELLTLKQRRFIHQAVDCHNNIYNEEAGLHSMYQTVDDRVRATRSIGTNYMKVPNIRSCTGRKAYSYSGPSFWNKLDSDTRQLEDKTAFKRHISKEI